MPLSFSGLPPHFWALALMIKEDYAEVGIPMLPVVKGEETTVQQIWIYTWLVVPCSLLLMYPPGKLRNRLWRDRSLFGL